jgi:hypothetical protein
MVWLQIGKAEPVRFPDEPGVKEAYTARGWSEVDEPKPTQPDLQPKGIEPIQDFVELYHPAVDASHDFPNNPGALEGARESGWIDPAEKKEKVKPKKTAEPEPKAKASAKATDEKE